MQPLQQYRNKSNTPVAHFRDYFIQPKLKIGQPNDKYEQEADRVADAVMRMPDPQVQMQPVEEEEEKLQMKPEQSDPLQMKQQAPQIQRMCPRCRERAIQGKPLNCPDCEKKLQMSPAIQRQGNGQMVASSDVTSQLSSSKGQGTKLPSPVQQEMSSKMGTDFSSVNIHTDSKSHQLNSQLGARAFTHGSDIYFNRGEYNPNSSGGKHLLAHELTHVVQQNGIENNPFVQMASCPVTSCKGIAPSLANCSVYAKNLWWLPTAYVNNATLACLETPNSPTANCVRKTLQDRLAATPAWLKYIAAGQKPLEVSNIAQYEAFVQTFITPRVYADHVYAYRTAGCPSGPAPYPAWIAVTTIPMPPGTVGLSIRYGGGSCSGDWGEWC